MRFFKPKHKDPFLTLYSETRKKTGIAPMWLVLEFQDAP